jgi:hypothetical protein
MVKVTLWQATQGPEGGKGIALLTLNLSARRGVWSKPRPGRFTTGKTRYPFYRSQCYLVSTLIHTQFVHSQICVYIYIYTYIYIRTYYCFPLYLESEQRNWEIYLLNCDKRVWVRLTDYECCRGIIFSDELCSCRCGGLVSLWVPATLRAKLQVALLPTGTSGAETWTLRVVD